MFVIPVIGTAGKRNPPLLTIALIVVNCIVYFFFQFNDNEQYCRAMDYYMSSGLERVELTAYIDYLRAGRKNMSSLPDVVNMDGALHSRFLRRMLRDTAFQDKLDRQEIITPAQEQFPKWQQMRKVYSERLSSVVFWQYGFRPAYHRPVTFLTHMFLHGGFDHLLGNMIVLWLVGCIVELGCGRLWYPAIYIPGGLAAVCLFWLIYPASIMPLVGASGAIAAVMGAFAVLYGTKKIKIFFSLGFYFGCRQVYGFVLLPFWIGNELYQVFFGGTSNVAYVAHIGGLIGGALIGLVCGKIHGTETAEEMFRQEPPDEISPLIEQAMEKMGTLDLAGARMLLEQVLNKEPANMKALQQLFALERHQPQGAQFHAAAERLLEKLCAGKETNAQACRVYADYGAAAKPQRLSPGLYVKVGLAHAETGLVEETEKIFAVLLRQRPGASGLPAALLKLAGAFRKTNLPDKATACLKAVAAKFPDSPAARIAATALAARKQEGLKS